MISPTIAFLNGFSAFLLVCFSAFILFYYTYSCKRSESHIVPSGIFLFLAVFFGWMGITLTFLSVVIYGYNLPGLINIVPLFSFSTIPIGALAIIYTVWDVAGSPRNKKYVLIGFIIYSIVYYLVLYTTFQQAVVTSDTGIIYDDWINPLSIFYYVLWGLNIMAMIITSIGFNKFRKAAPGDLHKRSMVLLLATPVFGMGILLNTVILMEAHVNILFIPRFMMIVGVFLVYYGFRPK